MGVGPVTFRSGGQISQHVRPGAYSRLDYVSGAGGNVSINNAALLGESEGGEPYRLYRFTNYTEAAGILIGGTLLDAIYHAFRPGGGLVPQAVFAMRVNNGTQATRSMDSSSTPILTITSADYGVQANQIVTQLEAATNSGKKFTLNFRDDDEYSVDDIERISLTIGYSGSGTPTVTVNATQLATTGADTDITAPFATYPTIRELVAWINDQPDFTAVANTSDDSQLSAQLDAVTTLALTGGEWVLKSDLQALIEIIENSPRIESAELATGSTPRTVPDNDGAVVYLTGGTKGSFTATEWTAALTRLLAEDVQIVMGVVSDAGIHNLIKNHVDFANSVNGRAERLFIVGGAEGETTDQVIARASALNSDGGALCYRDFTDFDINGNLRSWGSIYFAAKVVGMFAVLDLPEPATFKQVDVVSWTGTLTSSDIEELIQGGVLVGTTKRTGERIVERSVTTFQGNLLQRNEFSMRRTALFVNRDLREAVERIFIGRALNNTLIGRIDSIVTGRLSSYVDLGLFNGDPAYFGYQKVIDGDVIRIDYSCNLTPPANFAFITSHMQVFASTNA